jgi:hypothetical protein
MSNPPQALGWRGEPTNEDWMVEGSWLRMSYPSTMLRMVPQPTSFARREERQ